MKTIVNNENVSLYIFNDDEVIVQLDNKTTIGDPVRLNIADCNSTNTTVYNDVIPPDDWRGRKYLFNGSEWSENPVWIDPSDK